jgi:hypothetical protein
MTRRPWRLLPRFSLRLLLVCFLLVCVLIAVYRDPLRRQVERMVAARRPPLDFVVIDGPQTIGKPVAHDPPSPMEITQALAQRGTAHKLPPHSTMVLEPISDYVDPPQFTPTTGPYQVHHAQYKCTINSSLGKGTVYIDHRHRWFQ